MDTIKKIIAPLAIGIVVGLIVGNVTIGTRVDTRSTPVGAVSSPDIMSPYFSFGGVRQWSAHTASLAQATTTVCAIQSPVSTSTLEYASIRFSVSSSTASTVTIAKAATAYATTTSLASASVSANAQATVISKRTAAGGDALDETFGPSPWLVVGMAGGVGTFSPTGVCQATWIEN